MNGTNSSLIAHTAVCVFCIGAIVQTAAKDPDYIYGGQSPHEDQ